MTRRRELEQHRKSITEIRNIMNSMKNLAYLETRRLDRFMNAQRAVIESIQAAANDVLEHHPVTGPATTGTHELYLLVGTERGFCGDFNQALIHHLDNIEAQSENQIAIIAMGSKLQLLLSDDSRVVSSFEGASITDEVLPVLSRLTSELVRIKQGLHANMLYAISFKDEEQVITQRLLPSFSPDMKPRTSHTLPPRTNLPADDLLLDLGDHYLFARLNGLIYDSLMAENRRRITHLDAAVHKLDEETDALKKLGNSLRQEEIIEEIEVILLNAAKQDPLS